MEGKPENIKYGEATGLFEAKYKKWADEALTSWKLVFFRRLNE